MKSGLGILLVLGMASVVSASEPMPLVCSRALADRVRGSQRALAVAWSRRAAAAARLIELGELGGPALIWTAPRVGALSSELSVPKCFSSPLLDEILASGHGLIFMPGLSDAGRVIGPSHPYAQAWAKRDEVGAPRSGWWLIVGDRADEAVLIHERRHLKDAVEWVPEVSRRVGLALDHAPATDAYRQLIGSNFLVLLLEQRAETDELNARGEGSRVAALARLRSLADVVERDLEYLALVSPEVFRTLRVIFQDEALPGPLSPLEILPSVFPSR